MPSYARKNLLVNNLCYHIFNRGISRHYLFDDDNDKEYFKNLLLRYKNQHNFIIYHWVIMSNHYHMVLELDKPEQLSSIMSGIGRAYSHYYHAKYETSGYLWEGRFKAQAIEKEFYLHTCGRYIEQNPLRAKIVTHAEEYIYSSARYYTKGTRDEVTSRNPSYDEMGLTEEERRKNYSIWLKEFDGEGRIHFDIIENPMLGKGLFKSALKKVGGHFVPRTRGRLKD